MAVALSTAASKQTALALKAPAANEFRKSGKFSPSSLYTRPVSPPVFSGSGTTSRFYHKSPSGASCATCGKVVSVCGDLTRGPQFTSSARQLFADCPAGNSDHFDIPEDCLSQKVLRNIITLRVGTLPNVSHYDPDTAELFPSAFLKETDKEDGTSDLTGDGGALVKKMADSHDIDGADTVVDVGGQDGDSVRRFRARDRIVVDMNVASPFLCDRPDVKFAIGCAEKIFSSPDFLNPETRGQVLLTMSNFLNVLPAQVALRVFTTIASRLQPGDHLIITNLTPEQFENRGRYVIGSPVDDALHQVYEIDRNTGEQKPYKTVISSDFGSKVSKHTDLHEKDQRVAQLKIVLPNGKSSHVIFRTILFTAS